MESHNPAMFQTTNPWLYVYLNNNPMISQAYLARWGCDWPAGNSLRLDTDSSAEHLELGALYDVKLCSISMVELLAATLGNLYF